MTGEVQQDAGCPGSAVLPRQWSGSTLRTEALSRSKLREKGFFGIMKLGKRLRKPGVYKTPRWNKGKIC